MEESESLPKYRIENGLLLVSPMTSRETPITKPPENPNTEKTINLPPKTSPIKKSSAEIQERLRRIRILTE